MKIENISSQIRNNLLAFDTSGEEVGIGINGLVGRYHHDQNHTDNLLFEIDRLLKKAGVLPTDIAGVAFVSGPGSFTGLRIGATIANGIGWGNRVGVTGVSRFDIIRKLCPGLEMVVLDARRGEVFVEQKGKGPRLVAIEKLGNMLRRGDRVYVDTPELVGLVHPQLKKAGTIFIGPVSTDTTISLLMGWRVSKKYKQALPLYLREANITLKPSKTNQKSRGR